MSNGTFIKDIIDGYNEFLTTKGDHRVENWLFMQNPWSTIGISIFYMIGVTIVGPRLMKNRQPYNPKKVILFYNIAQVFFSLWLFIEIGRAGWFTGYNYMCQPMDYSNDEKTLRMVHVCWWFFFSKFTEFFDTLFLVLRKKNQQVSFLHVVHHGVMPFSVWIMVKFTPGGHGSFTGLINPLVHFVMYIYYFLAALGPRFEQYIWWKKYLTTFQMIQFMLTFLHAMQLFIFDCNYPKYTSWGVVFLSVLFFSLFLDFYIKDQMIQRKKRENKPKPKNKNDSYNPNNATTADAFVNRMYILRGEHHKCQ